MAKETIDLTTQASTSSPRSSKSKKSPKPKTSASSKKAQFKNEKCAQCSKPPKPNLNYNTKDLSRQTYGFPEVFQAQAAAAAAIPTVARPNTSLPQHGLNRLNPMISIEPLQMALFSCNMPPPQFESHAPNFNNHLSTPSLYNNSASNTASYYPNYLVRNNICRPLTLKLFPDSDVNSNTSAMNRRVDNYDASTVDSNDEEVDLELRLWFPMSS